MGNHLKLGPRHRPSGFNSHFQGKEQTFADYVRNTREMLFEVYRIAQLDDVDKRLAGNAPFELKPEGEYQRGQNKPYKRGVVLTHGLTDSPYFMRHLASFFQKCGWRVMAVLLPGNGSQPGDLLNVKWQEWSHTVAYGVEQLNKEVDDIYLAGLSAGAALSLFHAQHDSRVRGLFLYSPALRITPRAAWANFHKLYSWLLPSAKWVDILPDVDIYKYESFPKNAAYQMYELTQQIYGYAQQIELNIPVFAATSEDDATVDSGATLEFMAHTRHPGSKMVFYTRTPSVSPTNIPMNRIELVNSVIPEQNVLSFAHTSIVLSPTDEHYGPNGEYSNCLHYYGDGSENYAACLSRPSNLLQGELTEQNLSKGLMRRLMYNPHFTSLTASMQRFIESLP